MTKSLFAFQISLCSKEDFEINRRMNRSLLVRGGCMYKRIVTLENDPIWNLQDIERANTLEARWIAKGVCEEERRQLLPCAVWKAKFPGIIYNDAIESRLIMLQS